MQGTSCVIGLLLALAIFATSPAVAEVSESSSSLQQDLRDLKADNKALHERLDKLESEVKRRPKAIAADGRFVDIGNGKVKLLRDAESGERDK